VTAASSFKPGSRACVTLDCEHNMFVALSTQAA
jgi:hypothetical protein